MTARRECAGSRKARRPPPVGAYVVERADTRTVPCDPAGYWVDHVSANHGSLHFRFPDTAAFRARTVVQHSAEHRVVDFWSDGLHYAKTKSDVRADGDLGNMFFVARHGALELEQDGEQILLRRGQGALISKSRPLQLRHVSSAGGLTFDVADARVPDGLRHGPVLVDLQGGLGSVVVAMISAVSAHHESLDSYEFTRSCITIGELLFTRMLDRGALPDTLGSVEQAARDYVARHAADPDLTLTSLARSLGWSVRQVQLALQQSGTTASELIRSTRITRAVDLLRRSSPDTTISSVAFASGFRSTATFNAVFKQQFGISPREARALQTLDADFGAGCGGVPDSAAS
jgi:AraC-like DNA-binding protein